MADIPEGVKRDGTGQIVDMPVPVLDSESRTELCDFVGGVLIVRTEDGCVHYVPEESLSRWSRWKDPGTSKLKMKIWTDSGELPIMTFDNLADVESACAILAGALGEGEAGWNV